MRTLTGASLPLTEDEFFPLLKIWFPNIFDIKYIIRQCKPSMKGGLQELAQEMGVGNTVSSVPFLQENELLIYMLAHAQLHVRVCQLSSRHDIQANYGTVRSAFFNTLGREPVQRQSIWPWPYLYQRRGRQLALRHDFC